MVQTFRASGHLLLLTIPAFSLIVAPVDTTERRLLP
jgi:hypothetical protein